MGRAAGERKYAFGLGKQAIERFFALQTPVNGVHDFTVGETHLTGAGLCGDGKRATAPVHAQQLQQIQNPDLLQVTAHVATLGDRRARARRQCVHATRNVFELTAVELVSAQLAVREARRVQREDHRPRQQWISRESGA